MAVLLLCCFLNVYVPSHSLVRSPLSSPFPLQLPRPRRAHPVQSLSCVIISNCILLLLLLRCCGARWLVCRRRHKHIRRYRIINTAQAFVPAAIVFRLPHHPPAPPSPPSYPTRRRRRRRRPRVDCLLSFSAWYLIRSLIRSLRLIRTFDAHCTCQLFLLSSVCSIEWLFPFVEPLSLCEFAIFEPVELVQLGDYGVF